MLAIASLKIGEHTGHEAGRLLLRQLYEAHAGTPLPPILLEEKGKPYFADSPYHFSITHTRRHAFCALSDRPIGIDAEEADRDISLKLAQKILSPTELVQYEAAPDKRTALLTFWVLKEARAKLTGEGITHYPNHTVFSLDDPRVCLRDGCLLAIMEENDHAL